jgi:hypothetical protein
MICLYAKFRNPTPFIANQLKFKHISGGNHVVVSFIHFPVGSQLGTQGPFRCFCDHTYN